MAEAGAIRAGKAFIEIMSVDTNLLKGLDAAEKSLMAFGKKVTAVGGGLQDFGKSLLSVGLGAAVGIAVASKEFVRFDDALASIRANTNATDDEMKRISATILELSRTTGQGATSITTVFDELLKAGVKLEDVLGGVGKTVTEFSKVAKLGPEEAATVIVDAMTVFKVSATTAADVLSKAADASSVSLEQVVQSFAQFAVVGEQAGLTIQEVASSIALLGASGVKAGDAGTALKSFISMLSAPTSEGAKIFKKYGINVRDAGKNMLPLAGIVTELKKRLDKLNPQKKSKALKDLFGSDAIRPAVILMEKGAAGLEEFNQKMRDSLPVSQKYAILMDTIQGGLTRIMSAAERASIALGSALGPAFATMIGLISGLLKGMEQLITSNQAGILSFSRLIVQVIAASAAIIGLGTAIRVLGFAFAPYGVILGIVGGGLKALVMTLGSLQVGLAMVGGLFTTLSAGVMAVVKTGGLIIESFQIMGFTLATLGSALGNIGSLVLMVASPFNLFAIAVAAVVVILYKFTNVFQDAWAIIQQICNDMMVIVKDTFAEMTATVNQAMKGIFDAVMKGDIQLAWEILWQAGKIIWSQGVLAIQKIWDDWGMALLDVFSGMYDSLTGLWTSLWTGLKSIAVSVLYSINDEFITILGGMKKLWLGFFAAVSALVQEFMSGKLVTDFGGAMKRIAEKTKDQLEATDAETKGSLVAADDARDEALGKIAEERKASLAGFEEESTARRNASKEAIKARELELQKAKDVLTGLTDKAAALKDKLAGVPGAPEKKDIPKAVGKGLQDASDKIDTRGTFSAIGAARGLTVGETVSSKMEEMIAQERLANEELKKLNKAAKNGGLKFT